jgi:hypothetical protein
MSDDHDEPYEPQWMPKDRANDVCIAFALATGLPIEKADDEGRAGLAGLRADGMARHPPRRGRLPRSRRAEP